MFQLNPLGNYSCKFNGQNTAFTVPSPTPTPTPSPTPAANTCDARFGQAGLNGTVTGTQSACSAFCTNVFQLNPLGNYSCKFNGQNTAFTAPTPPPSRCEARFGQVGLVGTDTGTQAACSTYCTNAFRGNPYGNYSCTFNGQNTPFTAPSPTPSPTPAINIPSSATIQGGVLSQYTFGQSFTLVWQAGTGYVSMGQRNKIYSDSNALIQDNSAVGDWGASSGTSVIPVSAIGTAIFNGTSAIRINYEIMQKNAAGVWTPTGTVISIKILKP